MRSATLLAMLGLLIAGSLAQPSMSIAGTPPTLSFDPFRPRPEVDRQKPGAGDRRGEIFAPVLRSTVVAGRRSVANLGGEILALGEEAHGYRLVSVRAFDATFERDGEQIVLELSLAARAER